MRDDALRVAAVWGTTVIAHRTLGRGESFLFGDEPSAVLPIPDGLAMSASPLRAAQSGWELDASGAVSGLLMLRGRNEDPVALARTGAGVAVMPGDYGILQYGLFSVFFQYSASVETPTATRDWEWLALLAIVCSSVLHVGSLGLLRALLTPPPLDKPLALTDPDEYAARFGLRRTIAEVPPPSPPGDAPGGSGVKDPGMHDKKPQGGGKKIQGDEGKFGLKAAGDKTEIPGEPKPTTHYGGLSDVLDSDTGKEIKNTLKTIDSVASALSGLNGQNVVLGGGAGTGLRGGGGGGGGNSAGVAFGSGSLNTGFGAGNGGGFGAGSGGAGGRGAGGNGAGGSGGGAGGGNGSGNGGPSERGVSVAAGAPTSRGGLSQEQVRRVVAAHVGALRACYESEAQKNPSLKGGVTAAFQIDPSGSVSSASVANSSLGNPRVEGCVIRQVKSWRFPASDSPTIVGGYPFKFGVGG